MHWLLYITIPVATHARPVRWPHKMRPRRTGPENGESPGMLWVYREYGEKVKRDKLFEAAGATTYKNRIRSESIITLLSAQELPA